MTVEAFGAALNYWAVLAVLGGAIGCFLAWLTTKDQLSSFLISAAVGVALVLLFFPVPLDGAVNGIGGVANRINWYFVKGIWCVAWGGAALGTSLILRH